MKYGRIFFLALLFALLTNIAWAAPQVVKVSFNAKDTNPIVKSFREVFIPYVEQRTDGRYKFEVYPGGVLGAARQRIQSMRNGMIQMSVESSANLSQFAPNLSMLDLPYLVSDRKDLANLFRSPTGKELLNPLPKNISMRPLATMMSTFRVLGLNRPGKTLEEIKGAKIRTSNSKEHITCINSLGLTATPMPHSEAFTGLQQKVIEGIDLEVPTFQEDHFYEVASNIIKADYLPVVWVLGINENFFKKMPQADQKVFEEAAAAYEQAVSGEFDAFEAKALEEMSKIPGVTLTRLTEEEKEVWRNRSASAYETLTPEQALLIENIRNAMK